MCEASGGSRLSKNDRRNPLSLLGAVVGVVESLSSSQVWNSLKSGGFSLNRHKFGAFLASMKGSMLTIGAGSLWF